MPRWSCASPRMRPPHWLTDLQRRSADIVRSDTRPATSALTTGFVTSGTGPRVADRSESKRRAGATVGGCHATSCPFLGGPACGRWSVLGWPHTAHPYWSTCVTYANQTKTKTQGTNKTFSAGVGFGPISLSAQAGWDLTVSETWHFGGTSSKPCGSTSRGWVDSPEAEAHQA